jgi:N-acetylglutamate synthase-like GNAT family acetyltransferase
MLGRVALIVPASRSATAVADAVATGFAREAGLTDAASARLTDIVRRLVDFSIEQSYEGHAGGDIELQLELDAHGVGIDLHDWGAPMRRAGGPDGPLPAGLQPLERLASDVQLINLADRGKRIAVHLVAKHAVPVVDGGTDDAADADRGRRAQAREDIEIRDAEVSDAEDIAKLLWHGYVLAYRHRDFYRPSWIEQAIQAWQVLSTVACADGTVVGHHAVLVTAPDEAAESGVALIDRAWRGLGLFDPMFDHTLARARTAGLPAIFGRATCAHPFSQRAELKHGYRESALMLGGSPAAMAQAQRDDDHGSQKRGANLVSSRSLLEAPERALALPARYADELRALAEHVGVAVREPDPSAQPLPVPVAFVGDEEDGTAYLRISGDTLRGTRELGRLLRGDVARQAAVLYADVDLAVPGDDAVDALREQGFFLSGFIYAGPAGRDWLRLQRPQAPVEVESLALAGERGEWLLGRVLRDRREVE